MKSNKNVFGVTNEFFFEPGNIAAIKVSLRRTLVRHSLERRRTSTAGTLVKACLVRLDCMVAMIYF